MIRKKFFLGMAAGLLLSMFLPICLEAQTGSYTLPYKLDHQEDTIKLLKRLDELPNSYQNLNAIFTDQTEENICHYVELYNKITGILSDLEKNLKKWNKLIVRDENEKIYHTYAAAVQIAQYSIYSRPDVYLNFLKVFNSKHEHLSCPNQPQKDELLNYEDSSQEWKAKAEQILSHAKTSINKALKLGFKYEDAEILQAQILALDGEYDEAAESFAKMEKEGYFKKKRSLINSWRAYIELKKNNPVEAEKFLVRAYTFPEPILNSNWARNCRKFLKNSRCEWIVQHSPLFEPYVNIDLCELKAESKKNINKIGDILRIPLAKIPDKPDRKKLKQLAAQEAPDVMFTLETDRSKRNVEHYTKMLEDLYYAGEKLSKTIRNWEKLAGINKETAYYYLINKSSCSLVLLYMIKTTKSIVDNKSLGKNLKRLKQKDKEIDIAGKWSEWEKQIGNSLETDIRKALTGENDLIYVHILAFEYDALFSVPPKAVRRLDDLEQKLREKKIKKISTSFSSEIRVKAYISSWRAYLDFKKGDVKAVKKRVEEIEGFTGIDGWLRDQKKLIDLHSVQQERKNK